jgi:hypothetical protein
MTATDDFLQGLPGFARFEDVADAGRYAPLPDGWALAMADVVSSTAAIAAGKYKMVNMAAAAVITAVLNGMGRRDLPFVFGGDGAAVAVPPEGGGTARQALAEVARWIAEDLGLTMRVALVPVAAVRAAGQDVQVARFRPNAEVSYAMFAGGGSAWAEAQMKAGVFAVDPAAPGARPNLTGLSCRWNPVPARRGQIVSLIALPADPARLDAFRAMVAAVVAVAERGDGTGSPMPAAGPRVELDFRGAEIEEKAQGDRARPGAARRRARLQIFLSWLLHRTGLRLGGFDARRYAREVSANSDFRKFDDGLKMTIDIDAEGLAELRALLDRAAAGGVCRFGLHAQASALVTCLVPDAMRGDHMHFVDGAEGGYAQAAQAMKAHHPA